MLARYCQTDLIKEKFHEQPTRLCQREDPPADIVVDSHWGGLVARQIYYVANCCFAAIQEYRLGTRGNRFSAGLACVVRFYKSADDGESAWVGEGDRFDRNISLHAQSDLPRHGFDADRLPARVWECVGDSACAGVHPVDEQVSDRARRGILGEKVWGRVRRLQVPGEAMVVK